MYFNFFLWEEKEKPRRSGRIGKLNVYDADVQIEVNPLGQSNADFSKPHAAKSGAAQNKKNVVMIGLDDRLSAYTKDGEAVNWHLIHIGAAVFLCEQEMAALRFFSLPFSGEGILFSKLRYNLCGVRYNIFQVGKGVQ